MVGMGVWRCAIHWGISELGNQTVYALKKVFLTPTETPASCLTLLLGTLSFLKVRIRNRWKSVKAAHRTAINAGRGRQGQEGIRRNPVRNWHQKRAIQRSRLTPVLQPLSHKQENVRQGGVTDGVVHPDAALRLRPEIKNLAASGRESAPLSLRPSNESLYCRRWLNHAAIITLISWFPWDL